jgi:hypothetical protein
MSQAWSLVALAGLGVWHGLNPGMGWLFAVARGMQERQDRAVWRALLPLAAGHALAVGLVVVPVLLVGQMFPYRALQWGVAAVLVGFGGWRLVRGCRPRWVGMRVSGRELAGWSMLMATAHGAGLMVVPLVLGPSAASPMPAHAFHAALLPGFDVAGQTGLWTVLAHTAGHLLATGAAALLVYRRLGLRLLGRLWINLDVIWGAALIGTGLLTPLL